MKLENTDKNVYTSLSDKLIQAMVQLRRTSNLEIKRNK